MSSLARRSIRTTAAAAGLAALGVGLAGHAFAVPGARPCPAHPPYPAPTRSERCPSRAPWRGCCRRPGRTRWRAPRFPACSCSRCPPSRRGRRRPSTVCPDRATTRHSVRARSTRPGSTSLHSTRSGSTRPRRVGPDPLGPGSIGPGPIPAGASPRTCRGLDGLGLSQLPLAGPGLPQAPAVDGVAGAADLGGGLGQVDGPDVDPGELQGDNQVDALSSMDTAALFAGMAERAVAGDPLTGGNEIG